MYLLTKFKQCLFRFRNFQAFFFHISRLPSNSWLKNKAVIWIILRNLVDRFSGSFQEVVDLANCVAVCLDISRRILVRSAHQTQTCCSDAGTGGPGGPLAPQCLADQLTLFKLGRADYPHLSQLAPPKFFTFWHHCNGHRNRSRVWAIDTI